jgi:hypothetical protein
MCLFRFKAKKSEPSPEYAYWLSQQKTFQDVHHFIDDFTYQYDIDQFGITDYWQTPSQFFRTKTGDCEDVHLFLADAFYRALNWESYLLIGWKWERFLKPIAHGMSIITRPNVGLQLINYWDVIPMKHLRDKEALNRAGYTYFGGIFQMPDGKKVKG